MIIDSGADWRAQERCRDARRAASAAMTIAVIAALSMFMCGYTIGQQQESAWAARVCGRAGR